MHDWQSLSHVRWECKYHEVIIPKYRRRVSSSGVFVMSTPPTGATLRVRPPRGAILMPRPLAEVDY